METKLTEKEIKNAAMVKTVLFSRFGNVTKEELCDALMWSYPQRERQIRDVISDVAKYYPIIGLSGGKGYRGARFVSDLEDAEHQLNDLYARIDELTARTVPLKKFVAAARQLQRQKA